jgi:hypothetical protein
MGVLRRMHVSSLLACALVHDTTALLTLWCKVAAAIWHQPHKSLQALGIVVQQHSRQVCVWVPAQPESSSCRPQSHSHPSCEQLVQTKYRYSPAISSPEQYMQDGHPGMQSVDTMRRNLVPGYWSASVSSAAPSNWHGSSLHRPRYIGKSGNVMACSQAHQNHHPCVQQTSSHAVATSQS